MEIREKRVTHEGVVIEFEDSNCDTQVFLFDNINTDELLELSEAANKWWNREEEFKAEKDKACFLDKVVEMDLDGLREYKLKLQSFKNWQSKDTIQKSIERVEKFIELMEKGEMWDELRKDTAEQAKVEGWNPLGFNQKQMDAYNQLAKKARKWDEHQEQPATLTVANYHSDEYVTGLKNQISSLEYDLHQTEEYWINKFTEIVKAAVTK